MLTPEALMILSKRYLQASESPTDMFWRVARYVAAAEEKYGYDTEEIAARYFRLLSSLMFLPNSPTLMNAGKPQAQLAACFVLPIEDSLTGIFETLKSAALIQQSGGGTGFSFSRLRPRGDKIGTTGGTASGPVPFIGIFDKATAVVRQGAVRQGANMAVLRVDHPDIRQFITAKQDQAELTNFNLSVGVTDQFMQAVQDGKEFALINPRTGSACEKASANEVFQLLVRMAWTNGEPGVLFLDAVNKKNPTPALGEFETTNPCSEQPLLPFESCVLGSINLTAMVRQEKNDYNLDYQLLGDTIDCAVDFLDDVIDVNCYPLAAVRQATLATRKIGLGIMGLADVFILLDIPYASQQAVELTGRIMQVITDRARCRSAYLAEKRGSFPAWEQSIYAGQGQPVRNATVTTIAPTGTISLLANCASGIEPLFALSVSRRALDGQILQNMNPVALSYLERRGLMTAEIQQELVATGSVQSLQLTDHMKRVLVTAAEIKPEWHIRHLAAAQQYTDNGVSKTVNLPAAATTDDVADIFFAAWRSGCKGVTVYRDGSRAQQVLTSGLQSCLCVRES